MLKKTQKGCIMKKMSIFSANLSGTALLGACFFCGREKMNVFVTRNSPKNMKE